MLIVAEQWAPVAEEAAAAAENKTAVDEAAIKA